ncbi:hypothetical protein LTR78_003961 [Recurvomyces mirabilis]|uniref:Uncharacterized protein n=1 Tax=Recurvomyces mirabilis TaxID=574656 RepID=A0AAE1C308_9PEZI|nr:hypothetical protein LTR78_003961 [Recurvomyces mirabilis]KAK5153901.1 hypothetical protein LTS14_007121 [Recurvomyces mirabilis]
MAVELRALLRFDNLVAKGALLWHDAPPRNVAAVPFDFEFRIAKCLSHKPMDPVNAKRKTAFEDSDPDFVVLEQVGARYRLILNKYCVVRPQFVLHTQCLKPQTALLDFDDIHAAWTALDHLGENYVAIYNGGKDAGASIGHKHLQILPRPSSFGLDFLIMKYLRCEADNKDEKNGISRSARQLKLATLLSEVPYQLGVRGLSDGIDSSTVHNTYNELQEKLSLDHDSPNNLILTRDYIMLIPRHRAHIDQISGYIANAAAMMGMVWVQSENLFEGWLQYGPMRVLNAQTRPRNGAQGVP